MWFAVPSPLTFVSVARLQVWLFPRSAWHASWAWGLFVPSAQRQELMAQPLLAEELALALLNLPWLEGEAMRATWLAHHLSKYSRQFKHRKEEQQ